MEKIRLYSVYTPDEIIRRILKETEPLEGPTCYPVEIGYYAGNTCEPPFVKAEVYRYGEDSGQHLVFSTILDQNTTLEDFNDQICHVLRDKVDLCLKALKNGTSYEEELRKANKGNTNDNNGDLPF